VKSISLAEKIATTHLLLSCGATIHEINCVRKHLSHLKGGGLAKYCAPAHSHALILSDVLDDDLSVIASGTTVADASTFDEAIQVLQSKNVWQATPASVKTHLLKGKEGIINETPKPGDTIFSNTSHDLVGSNALSVAAMHHMAKSMDYHTILYRNPLCGEAREVAASFVRDAQKTLSATNAKRLAFITGGETTVTLKGSGKGRNQEMALAFVIAAEQYSLKEKWVFLSGGTDGIDGVSPAAGGIVDVNSTTRMHNAHVNAQERLNNNDSYHALKSADDD
jgi:hydroxypyruvate reductase